MKFDGYLITKMQFFELIQKRHSVRVFEEKEVEDEKVQRILEAARRAPSAGNLQAYRIVIVEDKVKKEQLSRAALGQESVAMAGVNLVFLADKEQSSWKYGERGEKLYCLQDATIAATYAQLATADLGLGCVWVGAFEEEEVREVLDINEELRPVCILAVGYSKEEPMKTLKKDLDDLIAKRYY